MFTSHKSQSDRSNTHPEGSNNTEPQGIPPKSLAVAAVAPDRKPAVPEQAALVVDNPGRNLEDNLGDNLGDILERGMDRRI